MVSQSSQRTLAQPPRPADPARSFNERSHGIMRKIHTLTTALSDFGVEVALLIRTPDVEFTYESEDGMLRNFNTDLPEENRFRPRDVESLFRGRVLACPSINSMSPLRGRSGALVADPVHQLRSLRLLCAIASRNRPVVPHFAEFASCKPKSRAS